MNVDWIIPCRYVEIHENLATMIGAGIDTLWPAELPATIQVTTAVRLTGLPEELADGRKHSARTIVRGPDGEIVSELEGEFELEGGPGDVAELHPEWLQGIVVNLAVAFEAGVEGTYKIEHAVDQSSATVAMHIRLGPEA
jgi:hypothetical protein